VVDLHWNTSPYFANAARTVNAKFKLVRAGLRVLAVDFRQPRTLVMIWFELHFGTNLPLGVLLI
jgi:hypothetical protein